MRTTTRDTRDVRDGVADVPLIVEHLLSQIEDLRATDGDPARIAELWAQIDVLQGR